MNLQSQIPSSTIPKRYSSKTIAIHDQTDLKQSIKKYFLETYEVYEKLFGYLATDQAYYIKAEPLRHPLIFYFGHTACLYVNKFLDHGIIRERINDQYEKMFAVGVDEMDWDDLNESHYVWPSVQQTREYRLKVKKMVLEVIFRSPQNKINNWLSNLWVILLNIEHERIHLQTSCVIMRRVPLQLIKPIKQFVECQHRKLSVQTIPINTMIEVSSWKGVWNRQKENAQTYGWDNQFGVKQFNVQSFKASQMLVSNGQYLEFVQNGGYNVLQYWTEEGRKWINSMKPSMPVFWRLADSKYQLRTVTQLIDMPWDWPAEVNNLQARAFCKWKSLKTGKNIRLPTQDEYYTVREALKKDQPSWQYQAVGNINMEYWMSPNPVNMFKTGDFYDVIGNVWQHTITPIYPFQNFQVHPVYEDFTSPTFDQRHDLIKGGSFISTGNASLYHARYAFRRHFYQFAGFRYIQSHIQLQDDLHSEQVVSDKNVEMNLRHHYLNDKSYIMEAVAAVNQLANKNKNKNRKGKKILTVGCSVGRMPFELEKGFQTSIGIDYTTRYFQMSIRLKHDKFLKIKDIDIDLSKIGIHPQKIQFYQMNPENPDQKKISDCDWILIDGFSLRKDRLSQTVRSILKLAARETTIGILSASGLNELSKEQGRDLIANHVNGSVQLLEQFILNTNNEDQSYLPKETQQNVQFRLNFYKIIEP